MRFIDRLTDSVAHVIAAAAVVSKRDDPTRRPPATAPVYTKWSTYPSAGLTPTRLAQIFREADTGEILQQAELYEEILEKDAHIQSQFQTRRLAVAGRTWEIVAVNENDPQSVDVAEFVRNAISRIRNWQGALEDLLDAVPKGFSALQIHWMRGSLPKHNDSLLVESLEWWHQKNFRFGRPTDITSNLSEIRRLDDADLLNGVDIQPYEFVIMHSQSRSGLPFRTALMRNVALLWMFKSFDVKSWIQFAEVYGLPLRVGRYPEGASDEAKKSLYDGLASLASDAAAIISEDTKIEFVEAAQKAASTAVFSDFVNWCNAEISKAVLGQTLSTEIGKTGGAFAAAQAHVGVSRDLFEADARKLDETITDQIVIPLVDLNFGPQDSYPYYKTSIEEAADLIQRAEIDTKLVTAGLPIGRRYFYETYDIPEPGPDDEIVIPVAGQPFAGPSTAKTIAAAQKKKLLGA